MTHTPTSSGVSAEAFEDAWQALSCDEQFALATRIAGNIGYDLTPERGEIDAPEHIVKARDPELQACIDAASKAFRETFAAYRPPPRPSSDTEPSAWLAEGPGWKRVVLNREAAEKLCADFGQIFPLYLSARPSSDTIGGGELVAWLLSEAKRAEDFAPRYQAASPFRIVWEERAKKLRECAAALQAPQYTGEPMLTPEQEAEIVEDINSGRWPYLQPSPPEGRQDGGVAVKALDLLASLDPDALNPEQFNAWCALTSALAQPEAPASLGKETMLDEEDLNTIEVIARNEQSGRITRFEVNELVRVYRAALAHRTPVEAVAPTEMCESCGGRGTQPDYVGDDMRCVETGCDACNGTGRAALAPGSASLAEDTDTMQPDVHDEGADFNGVVRPDRLSGGGDA